MHGAVWRQWKNHDVQQLKTNKERCVLIVSTYLGPITDLLEALVAAYALHWYHTHLADCLVFQGTKYWSDV